MTPPDTVIVLCTGRCGSMTLSRATAHLTNYTSAHEGRSYLTGPARLAYPARHIEIDNRLSWILGRLDRAFGDRAAYVHLTRDPEAVAQSFAKRANFGIMRAYRTEIVYRAARLNKSDGILDFARDYVDTVTENIRLFLRDKTHVRAMTLETMATDWPGFCDWIGAEGDMDAAAAEIATKHNPSRG